MKVELEVVYQTIENLHKACPQSSWRLVFYGRLPHQRRKQSG